MRHVKQSMNIAIFGCGIGGLAAASFLARDGHNITIFEQFDAPAPVGSGLVIQPVGMSVLAKLGLDDKATAMGAKIYRMVGHEAATHRTALDVAYGPQNGPHFGLGIHRASLFDILYVAAKRAGVGIVCNADVVDSTIHGSHRRVILNDGRSYGGFDLVIDASGAQSPISPLRARALPYGAVWGTVDWPTSGALRTDYLQQCYRRATHMAGVLPIGTLPGGTTSKAAVFWSLRVQDFDAWRAVKFSEWQDQVAAMWPDAAPFFSQLREHADLTIAQYTHGTMRRPFAERIAYIGDAAHRASPQLGQGANMALLDAVALADALRRGGIETALPAYAAARTRHVKLYQMLSWAFTPMYQSDSRTLPLIRDYVAAPASRVPPVSTVLTRLVRGTLVNGIRN